MDQSAWTINMPIDEPLILAIPKGRILEDVGQIMAHAGVEPEAVSYTHLTLPTTPYV